MGFPRRPRFPNGESGADVYDRVTLFEDHLTRDMVMGRYRGLNVVLVTHGLTLRIFLMRWFHWSTEQLLQVGVVGEGEGVTGRGGVGKGGSLKGKG
jgi:broad specificity phosphatase PhoE